MLTDTQVSTRNANAPLLYRSDLTAPGYTRPVKPVSNEIGTLNSPREKHVTEPIAARADAMDMLIQPARVAAEPAAVAGPQQSVDGTVIGVGNNTVRCELSVDGRFMQVQLPLALFPEDVSFGTPIRVEMASVGGYRMPQVSLREIDRNALRESDDELDHLLEAL